MAYYQGSALTPEAPRARGRRPAGRAQPLLRVMSAIAVVVILAHLPWSGLRRRLLVLDDVQIEGLHYLDAGRLRELAGLERGRDLLDVHCDRARQALLLHPRIERSEVTRSWPRGVRVHIVERLPVMLVDHGRPWEVDSAGVLLAPLADGAVADVPMLAGASFEGVPEGAWLHRPEVQRGLAWVRALSASQLQLSGRVSEIDVSDPLLTGLLLMNRTRVLASAWPPGVRVLSALRVVLADLDRQGTRVREVDLRFRDQVIVRPAASLPSGSDRDRVLAAGGQSARKSS